MVGGALERGGKEGHDRRKIRNQPTVFFSFFSNSLDQPLSKALFGPCVCLRFFWSGTWMGKRGYCTAAPRWWRGGMSRAPFSTPPQCNQFLTLVKISLPFCFQCRRARSQYPKDPHQGGLRGPGACSFWSGPLSTYTILFVCLSFMPPHFVR